MIRERRGLIHNLLAALATKPFVMLAGISGSGKTQLARRLAAGLAAGLVENEAYSGRVLGNEHSGPTYGRTLQLNGTLPQWEGTDGNEYIDVQEIEGSTPALRKTLQQTLKDRVAFLPVRPDWSDSRKVWGYYNPLTGLYYPTDALRVVLHAYLEFLAYGSAAPRHFLVLDELNLARVEYYLSDLLSLMECPCSFEDERIRMGEFASVHPFTRPLWTQSAPQIDLGAETSSHEQLYVGRMDSGWALAYHYLGLASSGSLLPRVPIDFDLVIHGADWARLAPPRIAFTPNLSIIGTVNVDETTFSFAPKVLDRAFVLEFNDVDYDAVCSSWPGYDDARRDLNTLQEILRPANLHFGYRVVHEMLGYLQNSQGGWSAQGDFLLMSKVLPKLRGGEDRLGSALPVLLAYTISGAQAEGSSLPDLHRQAAQLLGLLAEGKPLSALLGSLGRERACYPMAADKAYRMTRQLLDSGLASFF
ncbi:MAG: hypothetical protein RBU37_08625 [Myxococcota bacterium]|jgi:hypothetical protein|nr:hypothetical protein [Myxococcota bacterium]